MVLVLVLVLVLVEIIVYFIVQRSPIIISKKDVFPCISKKLIEKYNAFDKQLGWTNIKNTLKIEISKGKEIEYKYNSNGARFNEDVDDLPALISTWGDSFCQCREVSNTSTWQYILSKLSGKGVSNFGVGNYGVDQALLRLKNEYKLNPTPYVILAFTPYSITRITSVWKHFSEFGNVLAFKPRFIVKEDKLHFIPNVIAKKSMLSNNLNYLEHVELYDEHIGYIKKYTYRFPYIVSIFLSPTPFFRVVNQKIANVLFKLKRMQLAERFANSFFRPEIEYRKKLNLKHNKLLELIIEEFFVFSKDNDFKPIILHLPAIEDVRYYRQSSDAYYIKFPTPEGVEVFDFMECLSQVENLSDCFVDNLWGGHYSVAGNQKLAEFLEQKLHEINVKI